MTDNEKLRVALIGVGSFGSSFAHYIKAEAELIAIYDPSPERRQGFIRKEGLPIQEFNDYEDLLAKGDCDAVVVASPNHTHKDITTAAAHAGKHVFCEKPMATNVPDCWEMVRACQSNGVKLMIGHKRRLRPPWARMIHLQNCIGKAVGMTASIYYDARPYDHQGWWTREGKCGGILDLAGVHTIDWMRAMSGDVSTVYALSGPQIDSRYDFPDTLHAMLQFRSGVVATLNVSLGYPLQKFRESVGPRVVCHDGAMRLAAYLDHIDLHWQGRKDPEAHVERFDDLGFDHAYRKEFGDFVRWVAKGIDPCLTWQEGLRCVEVIEAAHRSAREGGRVIHLPLYPHLEIVQ